MAPTLNIIQVLRSALHYRLQFFRLHAAGFTKIRQLTVGTDKHHIPEMSCFLFHEACHLLTCAYTRLHSRLFEFGIICYCFAFLLFIKHIFSPIPLRAGQRSYPRDGLNP